ncbi:hypothetical protein [Rhizohabitans arisaemae]|uniref:hypothetical protein n=1 Tax=Rhizohabitans arisaemae TaxID=2720610 RepID=UPI0024B192FB|nr:hypothetical protein [Rhizohabitans arisaemae]
MRIRRSRTAVVIGVAILSLMGTPATHTHAAPIEPAPLPARGVDRVLLVNQARITKVSERILKAAEALPGDSGFAGSSTDQARSRLTLYWHGKVPAGVRSAADSDPGVQVTVVPAAFSLKTLKKAQQAVADQNPPGKRVNGLPSIVSAAPAVDGSGLEVEVETVKGLTTPGSPVRAKERFRTVTGEVPVTVTETTRPTFARHNGQAYGGAQYFVYGGTCSQGFSLWAWGSWSYMLTAGHCGTDGSWAYPPQGSTPYAHVVQRDVNHDTALLMPSHGSSQSHFRNQIWWGGPDEHSLRANVTGVAPPVSSNDLVCPSGGFSGSYCDVLVGNPNTFIDMENPLPPYQMIRIWDVATVIAFHGYNPVWGQGDSGGPVVTYDGNPAGNVAAVGTIISSYGELSPCRGFFYRTCMNRGVYARLDRFLARNPSFQLRTW